MPATPIVAPYVPTYAATEPYISVAEFKAGGTGDTVNNLVPGGDAAAQTNALEQKIAAASGWADGFCNQQLACTPVVQESSYMVRDGYVKIPLQQFPIVQLNAASFGEGSELTAATSLEGTLFPGPALVQIPAQTGPYGALRANVRIEYLAGYANTFTTASASIGASTLTVTDTLGMLPGLRLTIADPGKTEIRTVLSVTATTVTFTENLTYAHSAGVSVSALPPAVKQAVILATSVAIRVRGQTAVALPSMAGGMRIQGVTPTEVAMVAQAEDLLLPFRRVTLG